MQYSIALYSNGPLSTIAAYYKKARAQKKTDGQISKLAKRNAKLQHSIEVSSKKHEQQFQDLAALIAKVEKMAMPRQIVLNRRSNRCHKVLTHVMDVGSEAIAYSGWKYACVPVAFYKDVPHDATKLCATCLGETKAERADVRSNKKKGDA